MTRGVRPSVHLFNIRRSSALLLVATVATLLSACGDAAAPAPPGPIEKVTVITGLTELVPGQSTQLVATASRANGQVVSDAAITWLSEAPAIATVDGTGLVTAKTPGTAILAANAGNIRGTVAITVKVVPVASVAITSDTADVFVGSTMPITAEARDAASTVLVGRTITWATDNASVATVNSAGQVTGKSTGTAKITAASEGHTASIQVTVTKRPFASIVDSLRLAWNMPAMGGAIVTLNDGITAMAAAGTRRATGGAAVTTNDLWHLGSNMKAMTSMLAAVAVTQGRIQWTTTIAEALPELQNTILPAYQGVTLRELLSHQSGMQLSILPAAFSGATAADQRASVVTWAVKNPPQVPRGTFLYSNVGYVTAAAMLERVFGTSFEDAIATHVFAPLGMTDVGWGPQAAAGSTTQPVAHKWVNNAWVAQEGYDSPPGSAGAGHLHMTLTSWARFIQEMLRVESGASTIASSDVAQQTMTQVITVSGAEKYGMGWYVSAAPWANGKVVYHNGSNLANQSLTYFAPLRNVGFIATVNGHDPGGRTGQALNDLIFRMLLFYESGQ